jgi:hypothetical protein
MKKLFMILFTAGITSISFAQNRSTVYNDNRDHNISNVKGGNGGYSSTGSSWERDRQISAINRDFDKRIRDIQFDRRMRDSEKRRLISKLQRERNEDLRRCNDRFNNQRNASSNRNDKGGYGRDQRSNSKY